MTALIPAAALADLFLKKMINKQPDDRYPRPILRGWICLEKFHNYGFSLGRGRENPGLVSAAVAGVYTLCLGFFLPGLHTSGRRLPRIGAALILGGGFSNLFDRLKQGYVVDYIRFPHSPFRHLIMNIGDLCLFAGTLLMAGDALLPDDPSES